MSVSSNERVAHVKDKKVVLICLTLDDDIL